MNRPYSLKSLCPKFILNYRVFRTIEVRLIVVLRFTVMSLCRHLSILLLLDFSLTVKAAPHECVIWNNQPKA